MEKELKNKIALVTSSTRGIGLACAEKLAENGAKVYLAVRKHDLGRRIADRIIASGGDADTVYFDAEKPETCISMVEETIAKEGRIDILVNNFGTTDPTRDLSLVEGDSRAFFNIVEINLRSVYLPTKRVVRSMLGTGGGSIVNISSIGGSIPDLSRTAYGVAKAAINFLTRDIAVQYARYGIRCNAVLPGLTATDAVMKNMSHEFLESFLTNVPLNRAGRSEEIAEAVLFLASERSAYITGQLLSVAGGYGIPSPMYNLYMSTKKKV